MFRAAALTLSLCLVSPALAQVVEPEGYRMEEYRGPVPETLAGVTVVDSDAAFALWKTDRVGFVDVLPRAPKPDNLPKGTIWREKPRHSIPGAIWLPNVGYGALADVTEAYFRVGLEKASGGDMEHPLVFFCLDECWMSWNAAKRARSWGYSHVFWFPAGTDGWEWDDRETEVIEPEPGY